MERRKFIAGLTTAGIGAGAFVSTMTASAQVEAGMFDVQEEYTVDTRSGRVESITLENINVTASWENFDNPATTVEWMLEVTRNAPGMSLESEQLATVSAEVAEPDFGGSESTTIPDQDLVEAFGEGSFDAPSEVPGPGYGNGGEITEAFDVSFGLRATVTDSEGNSHSQYVGGSTDLGINNQRADVGASGEGDLTAEEAAAGEPNGYGTSIPTAGNQAQFDQLQGMDIPDPFQVTAVNTGRSGESGEVAVTAFYGGYDGAPNDRLGPAPTPDDYDGEGVTQFTIGSAGSGADLPTSIAPGSVSGDASLVNLIEMGNEPDELYVGSP